MRKIIYLRWALILVVLLYSNAVGQAARDGDLEAPNVECAGLEVPEGNRPFFRTYAIGVQVYRWNGTSWDFVAPVANLYADPGFHGQVGTHYAGPTWESNSGSRVVARRVDGCTVDPDSIQWLLLEAVSTTGPGIFGKVTFIQRVFTVGGLAPAAAGSTVGDVVRIPYTTEYYFYRASNGGPR